MSRAGLYGVVAGLLAGVLVACARPRAEPLRFAPLAMHPEGAWREAPDGAVDFAGDGAVWIDLYFEEGPIQVSLEVKKDAPSAARGEIFIGTRSLGALTFEPGMQRAVALNGDVERRGTMRLRLAVDVTPGAGRLRLDRVSVGQGR